MSGARWALRDELGRPTTANSERGRNSHWSQAAATTRVRRQWYAAAARKAAIPALGRIAVAVTPLHKDRRSPQDVGACSPAAKAAIDGLVDAGVIPDDTPQFLCAVLYLPPLVWGANGMQLTVIDATDPAWADTLPSLLQDQDTP
jgi:crossover junction endodeoxyribonuclease RusA